MSHFTRCKTKISDAAALKQALLDMGLKEVEVHQTATNLYGYQNDKRDQTAEVIVRRKFVGGMSNDIGFKRGEDGTFEAIISEYDKTKYSAGWLKKLNQRYTFRKVSAELEDMGYEVGQVVNENGKITFEAQSVYGG
jgi:hypothetical protein